jgi:hypothetical protein
MEPSIAVWYVDNNSRIRPRFFTLYLDQSSQELQRLSHHTKEDIWFGSFASSISLAMGLNDRESIYIQEVSTCTRETRES